MNRKLLNIGRIGFAAAALLIAMVCSEMTGQGQSASLKFYPFRTVELLYAYSGSTTGSQRLIFDDYGRKQKEETKSETKMFGFTTKTNEVKLNDNGYIYQWIVGEKTGSKMKNELIMSMMDEGIANPEDAWEKTKAYLKLVKVGNEPILGKPCEIWEGSGVKFWFWKYLTLKSEITIAGQTMVLTATSVKTDVPIAASEWVLPTNVVFKEVDLENPDVEGDQGGSPTNSEKEDIEIAKQQLKGLLKGLGK